MTAPSSTSAAALVYAILGATGSIGSNLAHRLAAGGAHLMLGARDPGRLAKLAGVVRTRAYPLDATHFDEVQGFLEQTQKVYGRVDGIANCVGSALLKPAHLVSEGEWTNAMWANLGSAFAVVRAAGSVMLATGGSVVLLSSAAGRIGMANHEVMAAAKAGVIGLTRAAAASYAPNGIRVNCVAPGMVHTPATAHLTAQEPAARFMAAMHPLGRMGEPADVAAAIAWLLHPGQQWVTGQVIGVDGGLSTVRNWSAP